MAARNIPAVSGGFRLPLPAFPAGSVRSGFAAAVVLLGFASAASAETVKVAFIEGLSGPFAPVGQNILKEYQYIADLANAKGWAGKDVKFEMVPFDGKASPQESLTQLKSVIDQGIRYVTQGNGSAVALALSDAISKHNERNPGKEVVFFNYAAVDPALTNEKCSFWHFRARRECRSEDGSAHHLHEGQQGHQEGLPDQPELLLRPGGGQGSQGNAGAQAARRADRGRRPPSHRPGEGFFAVHLEDPAVGR